MPSWMGQALSRNASPKLAGRDHMNQKETRGNKCHLQIVSSTTAQECWPDAQEKHGAHLKQKQE